MLKNSIQAKTRFSDLDTQRHVTSRTYEHFCMEGRHRLLEENGFPASRILEESINIRPAACYVKFINQQQAGAVLDVNTEAYVLGEGAIFWNQSVLQPDGKTALLLQLTTESDKGGRPLAVLPGGPEQCAESQITEISAFSGTCKRWQSVLFAPYSDRNLFGAYSPAALWRIFEDGRWLFSERLGITYEKMVELDTITFWMGGVFQFYRPMLAGASLAVYSWIEKLEGIRCYIRQDVTTEDGTLIMSSREEHLIVSLQKSRPRKAPPDYIRLVENFIEMQ